MRRKGGREKKKNQNVCGWGGVREGKKKREQESEDSKLCDDGGVERRKKRKSENWESAKGSTERIRKGQTSSSTSRNGAQWE